MNQNREFIQYNIYIYSDNLYCYIELKMHRYDTKKRNVVIDEREVKIKQIRMQ